MSQSRARGSAAAVALVLAFVLSACTGQDPQPSPTTTVESPAPDADPTPTDTATTTEEATDTEGTADDATEEFFSRFEAGIASMTTAHMAMEMVLDGETMVSGDGVIDYTTTPPSSAMSMTTPAGASDVISLGGTMWVNLGELYENMWVEVPEAEVDTAAQSDPLAQLSDMRDFTIGVVKTGSETINGAEADRYVVTADTSKMPTDSDVSALGATVDYQIWLDGEGRIVQMVVEQTVDEQTLVVTTTLSDFGAPVTIEPPSADQITDLSSLGQTG